MLTSLYKFAGIRRSFSDFFSTRAGFLPWIFFFLTSLTLAHANAAATTVNIISYDHYMKQLIGLAKQNPQKPYAAMIIDNATGKILCEGVNASKTNPTLHGEIVAINNCAAKYPKINWAETTLITDAEPCAMCASAIVWAHISKVVYGSSITFFEKQGWEPIHIRAEYVMKKAPFYKGTILGGVLHEETDKVFLKAYKNAY
jgi:tRNA(adenine34) deaminase